MTRDVIFSAEAPGMTADAAFLAEAAGVEEGTRWD